MLHNPETIYRKEGDSFEKEKNASVFKNWRNKFSAVFLADFHDKMWDMERVNLHGYGYTLSLLSVRQVITICPNKHTYSLRNIDKANLKW